MVCFSGCLMSSASLQKLFCGVCSVLKCSFEEFVREKVVFPSYSSAIFSWSSILSFFLELFLHWAPVVYWAPTNLGSSSFIILSFCLFLLFMGFSRQIYQSGWPFPSLVDHILSDLSTITCPSCVAPWAWISFIDLDKTVVIVWLDWLVSVIMVSVCLPSDALLQHLSSYLDFS